MSNNNIKRTKFNICVLGESQVGKSSIISRLKGDPFNEIGLLTAGIDYFIDEEIIEGEKYKFKIFDTAGQERYKSISCSAIKLAEGFMLVFSVTNKDSFVKINDWLTSIQNEVNLSTKSIVLIGNKIDLPDREISNEDALNFSKSLNLKYFETSAKTGQGIKEVFKELYNDIYKLQKQIGIKKGNIQIKRRISEDKKRVVVNFYLIIFI